MRPALGRNERGMTFVTFATFSVSSFLTSAFSISGMDRVPFGR